MPYWYSNLEFWGSPDHSPDIALLPPASSGVPARFEQAGRTLNFGLLAGELLGINIEDAQRMIDDVDMLPESIAHVFLKEDIALLLDVLTRVRDTLGGAVDSEARPLGEKGRSLAEHPLIGHSSEGELFFRSQHVDLADLRADLDRMCAFLAWANGHGLLVAKR